MELVAKVLNNLDNNFLVKCFNAKDNTYPEGPGAGVEDNTNLILCLKNVPQTMDNQALKNILSNYGTIINITSMKNVPNPYRFAQCKDVTSLEAVLRGMCINEWNIQVSQKKEKKIKSSNSELDNEIFEPKPFPNASIGHNIIDNHKIIDNNFMVRCLNAKDNTYPEGPGAGLEDNTNLILCLKNVPQTMDNQALKNILSNYGTIINLTSMKNVPNPYRFAQCKDVTSLEGVLRGMCINEWNIQVSQKIEKKIKSSNSELDNEIFEPKTFSNASIGHNIIDNHKIIDNNFMVRCFYAKGNTYPEGPGAGLEDNTNLILCLKNVPQTMDNQVLKNILSNYGTITNITSMKNVPNPYRFAQCKDVTSLEAVLKGMCINEWNIEVSQKIERQIKSSNSELDNEIFEPKPFPNASIGHNIIDNHKIIDNNFMVRCFNAKDNTYPEGPGAGLEDNTNLILCLKNVPQTMDNQALKNILSNYGTIINITSMKNVPNPYRFAQCKDVTSLEAVLRGMCINEWNIEVSQKIERQIKSSNSELDNEIFEPKPFPNASIGQSAKLTYEDSVHPCLSILISHKFVNQSSKSMYFQNKHVTEYIYNIGNKSKDFVCDSRYHLIDIRRNEFYKPSNCDHNAIIRKCFVCEKFATKSCKICNEYYCSKECQRADWLSHQFKCNDKLQPRNLINCKSINDPFISLRSFKEIMRSNQKVIVTHVEKSNLVFIRSIEKRDQEDYIRILNIISSYAFKSETLSNLPEVGSLVLSEYNSEWYRAIVLHSLNENEILIAYPDFGNTELKSKSELKKLPSILIDLKQFLYCVSLRDVKDVILNEQAKLFLYSLVNDYVKLKLKYNKNENLDDKFNVDLITLETNQNINKKLNSLINPVKRAYDVSETSILFQDVNVIKFKPCNDVKLMILDNSFIQLGFIHCIQNNDVEFLEKINAQIMSYATLHSGYYTPREDEICLAKTSDKPETWYRAVCEVVSGNGRPALTLLDYGNICEISIENIRKCPKQLNLPCFTNMCYIKGFQKAVKNEKINNNMTIKLQDILKPYSFLDVREISLIDGDIFITLPEKIINRIKNENIMEYDEDY